jgi:hypothetical protein
MLLSWINAPDGTNGETKKIKPTAAMAYTDDLMII